MKILVQFTLIFVLASTNSVNSQEFSEDRLNFIETFSSKMCGQIKQEGFASSEKFQGELKAGLSFFFKKFVDGGASGKAEYSEEKYEGILRKDLASALKDTQECKLSIFNKLSSISEQKKINQISHILYPGNKPTPQNACTRLASPNSLIIFLGSTTVAAEEFPHTILQVKGQKLIRITRHVDKSLGLYLTVYSKDGREIVRIEDNVFVINFNNYMGISHPDGTNSLNVQSLDQETVLKIIYINESAISIQGHFTSNGISIPVGIDSMQVGRIDMRNNCFINSGSDITVN